MTREAETVPRASFRSYYGRPVLKEPTWKVPDVPLYLFAGGLSGVAATAGMAADLTGYPGLARSARPLAAGGVLVSVGALIHDLGRPGRFLNMLRVFRPTSPLSVGSWILAPFSAAAVGAAGLQLTGWLPLLGRTATVFSGVLGPAMATYTAVLLSDTAVPAWHEYFRWLPFLFAGSAVASAGGGLLLFVPAAEQGPARALVFLGAGLEQAAAARLERGGELVGEPYRTGRPHKLLRAGRVLTVAGAGLVLAGGLARGLGRRPSGRGSRMLAGRWSRLLSGLGGAAVAAGGLCTRFGIFYAGLDSARDPKYVVQPQRERLSANAP